MLKRFASLALSETQFGLLSRTPAGLLQTRVLYDSAVVQKPIVALENAAREHLADIFHQEFIRDPAAAASAIAALPQEHTHRILNAITERQAAPGSPTYLHDLFQHADANGDGSLDPDELGHALKKHELNGVDTRVEPANTQELIQVFTSSALPFIGFGFLDNLIMIVAGDYIDATVGGAFCLSTMAAAGLGNLISDVAGIFCADWIQIRAKVFHYGHMPELSSVQQHMPAVFWTKTCGAVVGISLGCLLGMFPLLFTSHAAGH